MEIIKPNQIRSPDDILWAKKTEDGTKVLVKLSNSKLYLVDIDPNKIELEFNPGNIEAMIMALLKK